MRQTNDRLKEREELIRVQYEKLKEADKMKNEFINIAAHELRTPIQPILGLTGVLRSKIKDTGQQELLNVTIRNARRLQQLTEDILDVTKIGSQSLNLKNESFNLNDIITNTIDDITTNMVSSQKSYERNAIKLVYQPHHIFIEADKARITQVISNLLGNAVKFTEAKATKGGNDGDREEAKGGGIISIKAEKVDGHALVTVKDSGSGIDPGIMPRLFEKFVSKSYQGTGLGLYISKSIVEAHGGKIWAENNTDAKGATFTFSLPVNKSSGSSRKFDKQS